MPHDHQVHFGVFEADLRAGELRRSGLRVHLQEQPFHILQMLLARPGETVTRDEIKQALWPDNQFGDFDHAINVAVKKLRDALGDDPENPRFVETMARRGYRFIARFNCNHEPAPVPQTLKSSRPLQVTSGMALVVIVAALLIWRGPTPSPAYQPRALTALQGVADEPAFSPDGNEVAFVWWSSRPGQSRLYLQAIGSVVARPLIDDPEPNRRELSPRWFPDGRNLAFIRQEPGKPKEVWIVPASGGSPRKLLDGPQAIAPVCCNKAGDILNFDISPDGKTIVTAEVSSKEATSLYAVSLPDMNRRRLTFPPENTIWALNSYLAGDRMPSLSPDGRSIVFVRLHGNRADLMLVPFAGGQPERLTDEDTTLGNETRLGSYAWAADGKSLLIDGWRPVVGGTRSLWRLWPQHRRWEPLSISNVESPTFSRDGRLAFVQWTHQSNLWRFELPRHGRPTHEPVNLTRSTSRNLQPKLSPDGTRLAFGSLRSGHSEIYVSKNDGSNPVQLTSFNGKDAGSPRWSPDGKHIVFDYRPGRSAQIFVIDANGGPPRQLTFGEMDNIVPSYSQDGRWIYFRRLRRGGSDTWKLPSDGGEPTLVVTGAGGVEESSDGKNLYYMRLSLEGMYVRAVGGGPERLLFKEDLYFGPKIVMNDGIFYMRRLAEERDIPGYLSAEDLVFYRFATGRIEKILRIPFVTEGNINVSISPDRSYLVVSKPEPQSNIMLVENFR